MDIIACTCSNVGPFFGKSLSVFFQKGKYLIKAPVGSGKSFLFFDVPLFALYKFSRRKILNRKAKQGFLSLLFFHDETYWYIERTLRATPKGGDSVSSRLFSVDDACVHASGILQEKDIVQYDKDIGTMLGQKKQEISFKSQKELESAMRDLLPAREVSTSIYFLSQNADYVFNMTAGSRISIFKNIFGLLGIDHGKEVLRDKKKEIQTKIMIASDDTSHMERYKTIVSRIVSSQNSLLKIFDTHDIKDEIQQCRSGSYRYDNVIDKHTSSTIPKSSDIQGEKEQWERILSRIISLRIQANAHMGRMQELQEQHKKEKEELYTMQKRYASLQKQEKMQKQDIDRLCAVDRDKYDREEKHYIQKQQELLLQIDDKAWSSMNVQYGNFHDLVQAIEHYKAQGKQYVLEKEKYLMRIEHQKQIVLQKQKRKEDLEKQREVLMKQYKEKDNFYCKKIDDACPYIAVIKGKNNDILREQYEKYEKEIAILEKEIASYDDSAEKRKCEMYDKKIQQARTVLRDIHRKDIIQCYHKRKDYDEKIQDIQKKKRKLDTYHSVLEQKKQEYNVLIGTMQSLYRQIQEKQKLVDSYARKMQEHMLRSLSDDLKRLGQGEDCTRSMIYDYEKLLSLLQEYQERKKALLALREYEKRIKVLYNIFSKELLLLTLRDFLPHLENTINYYLEQMVDFQIQFSLSDQGGEKIELQIFVLDDRGKRELESLSGGQNSLLKLAWILSISILKNASFVFLDETMNSLDEESIARVTQVLDRFVEDHNIKFYVITHSPQIQEMEIWDDIVCLEQMQ